MKTIAAPSPNADARPPGAAVDHLVLHYTGMRSAGAALARLCDPAAKVSSHYLVNEDGAVYALVEEANRAWHAGVSYWRGVRQLNDRSVGIEIVNPGHEFGYRPFPARQMAAVANLCRGILARHDIPARNVDPGELFDWRWLAARGVGVWTDQTAAPGQLIADLAAIGYDTALPEAVVITSFQRRFLPEAMTGRDDPATAARAAAVRALLDGAP